MSRLVSLFGDDIATNTKLDELLTQLKSLTGVGDVTRLIDASPTIDNPTQIYIGTAPSGEPETERNWSIQLVLITPTSVSIRQAKNAAWSNRQSEVYL